MAAKVVNIASHLRPGEISRLRALQCTIDSSIREANREEDGIFSIGTDGPLTPSQIFGLRKRYTHWNINEYYERKSGHWLQFEQK
jgi:hypothetical protein